MARVQWKTHICSDNYKTLLSAAEPGWTELMGCRQEKGWLWLGKEKSGRAPTFKRRPEPLLDRPMQVSQEVRREEERSPYGAGYEKV